MDPLGVDAADWSIGYGRAYEIDGLRLYANWGGGSYTARAVARVGQLMLERGRWRGRSLIGAARVTRSVGWAGTPKQTRSPDNPAPASGLGWWTNADGAWPGVPSDAFAGAGAGHQLLLVVPSLSLVVVRNGGRLEAGGDPEAFWGPAVRRVFAPAVAAVAPAEQRPPYSASPVITAVTWAPASEITRAAAGSDNWPMTWGDDDAQYTAYGDGWGFDPRIDRKLSLGLAKVLGPPGAYKALNIRSPSAERTGEGARGEKASGLLMVEGVLYMWVRNAANSRLGWSSDRGRSWTWSDWKFSASFGHPAFLNFGRNYGGARDRFVYLYSHDQDSAYEPADRMVLARAPIERIRDRHAYQFFAGLGADGGPLWTADIAARGAVFEDRGRCYRSQIGYNAGLQRYLWCQVQPHGDPRFAGGFAIYDAPEPWGPWTTVYFTSQWDVGPGENCSLPGKWMSADGRTARLVFSGNDSFSVRQVNFRTAGRSSGRYPRSTNPDGRR